MNKHEFIAQLSRLLKVPAADRQNIIEEYESYINEAVSFGEIEEDIIASLETPEQIAEQVNRELGGSKQHSDDSFHESKKTTSKSRDFFEELDADLEKAFETSEKAIRKAGQTIQKSVENINFKGILDKVMDGVDKVVDTVMDIDIKGAASVVAMRFDNSKVETFSTSTSSLMVTIDDLNNDSLMVEVVPGQSKLMVKYLPTSLRVDVTLNNDQLHIHVPQTSIKFAEKKRLRIYLPEAIRTLSIDSNCAISLKDLTANLAIHVKDAPMSLKDIHADEISLEQTDGPLSIKDISAKKVIVNVEDGPAAIKDVDVTSIEVHLEDGPLTMAHVRADDAWVEASDGPKIIKDSSIKRLVLQCEDGPISMKDLKIGVLSGQVEDSIINMKDCVIQDNQLGGIK